MGEGWAFMFGYVSKEKLFEDKHFLQIEQHTVITSVHFHSVELWCLKLEDAD